MVDSDTRFFVPKEAQDEDIKRSTQKGGDTAQSRKRWRGRTAGRRVVRAASTPSGVGVGATAWTGRPAARRASAVVGPIEMTWRHVPDAEWRGWRQEAATGSEATWCATVWTPEGLKKTIAKAAEGPATTRASECSAAGSMPGTVV